MSTPFLALVSRLLLEQQGAGDPKPLLCYGLATEDASLPARQAAMLQILQSSLEEHLRPGNSLLLAGPSQHGLLDFCLGKSVDVTLVQADEEQVASADASVLKGDFLDHGASNAYDFVVLEGTVRYLDQLPTLQHLRKLLHEGGACLLLAEFLDDDSGIEASELPNLTSFRQLAQRLGFQLLQERDFSEDARQSLVLLQSCSEHWFQAGQSGLGEDGRQALSGQLQSMLAGFEARRRCLRLFELRYAPAETDSHRDVEYAAINEFHPRDVATLFEKSFDTAFDEAVWRWKYETGAGRCVIARQADSGQILAHYGGAPRRIHYFSNPALAIQVCDVMALPEVRRQYGQNSLFFKTAATFLEREIGNTVGHLLGFGFPNQKAMNIAKRLGLYDKTDDFIELEIAITEQYRGQLQVQSLEPDDNPALLEAIDRLWQLMQAGFARDIIGVRDADYFRYRYLQHPGHGRGLYHYRQLLDEQGQLCAIAVCKRHGENWLLLDLICARESLASALSAMAEWAAAGNEPAALKFWLTKGQLDALSGASYSVHELGIEIPCNSWNPGPAADLLYGKWWLTAGDMDFM
jgi:hypothetical protein